MDSYPIYQLVQLLALVSLLLQSGAVVTDDWTPSCSSSGINAFQCKTYEGEPFPLNLDPKAEEISIAYEGHQNFQLRAAMVARYKFLRKLLISGNINSIEELTFATAYHLKSLTISYSQLQHFHFSAFGYNSSLQELHLIHNMNMTKLPVNVFHSLTQLSILDLKYSHHIELCENSNKSIAKEFYMLKNLKVLKLNGVGMHCENIAPSFFKPLENITSLDLGQSYLFKADQRILRPLSSLSELYMFNVIPYRDCPNLFGNLSKNLQKLNIESWRSYTPLSDNCTMTKKILHGLTQLEHLSFLSFKYSDLIFGPVLRKSTFTGLSKLTTLNLQW